MGKHVIHDIHLRFTFKRLWAIFYESSSTLIKNKDTTSNKDITASSVGE
ncbi:MAG: hypothetical protein ACTHKF_00780 [Candidatus Nitrosocosmicus sp.]